MLHITEFDCFFLFAGLVKTTIPTHKQASPIRRLSKFFSNRRFSQISIIFGSVGGGKSLHSPVSTYLLFEQKKLFLEPGSGKVPARWQCTTCYWHRMETIERCSSTMSQEEVLAGCNSFRMSLKYVWESTTSENGLISRFSSVDAWREYYNHHISWKTINTCAMISKVGCKAFAG